MFGMPPGGQPFRVLDSSEAQVAIRELSASAPDLDVSWLRVGGTQDQVVTRNEVEHHADQVVLDWMRDPVQTVQGFDSVLSPGQYAALHNSAVRYGQIGRAKLVAQSAHRRRIGSDKRLLAQADSVPALGLISMGQTEPNAYYQAAVFGSRQMTVEDLWTQLDFVPPPPEWPFDMLESTLFQENHLIGTMLHRIGKSIRKRGLTFPKFEYVDSSLENQNLDREEVQKLRDWVANVNRNNPFLRIMAQSAIRVYATGNSFIEVIPDRDGPDQMPAGLDDAITSTFRPIRGHRGYVQYVVGQFRWFNPYMWNLSDREEGTKRWEEHWQARGINPYDQKFAASPWARMIASNMPEGVWNPYLSSVIHIKGENLTSKYWGFPVAYRGGALHALLNYTLQYNISYQRNNQVPQYIVQYRGALSDDSRTAIESFLSASRGPENIGFVPIIQAPQTRLGGAGEAKTGIELVPVSAENKDGLFTALWGAIKRDSAIVMDYPYDLLSTENSNRSTSDNAREGLEEDVVNYIMDIHEEPMQHVTKDHMGFQRRYVAFPRAKIGDRLQTAQAAAALVQTGVFSPNKALQEFYNSDGYEGGEQHFINKNFYPVGADISSPQEGLDAAAVGAAIDTSVGMGAQDNEADVVVGN